ncbi:C6 transcription factor [Lasiodiplodia theobromae]|uniref:C6 transcription factor n=1 Tax=Lasiodiplodia theobromae TaxID=45133 RepID=UPI0015C35F65|nr:C6 transcription factor [Lasiodiplodia theobromae]KAF4542910.1 C6 transcription factor [Lasiodiplodia theobromae]
MTSNALAQPSTASTDEITEERGLELLRYYRYHVAPWLDMLDLDHHLGLYLPTVGAESPSAIYALYALSARHRELACGVPDMAQFESERFYNMSKWGTKAMYATDASDALEARMIRLIVDLISTPFSSWTPILGQTVNSSTPLHAYAHKPGLAASLFWCIFRFDLAAALVNETHMTTDLDTLITLDRLPDGVLGVFENVGFDDNVDPACVDRNASFENWDLCMIACVLRAARKMTHRDQQAAVLATLRLARETTGWKIDGDMQNLQEFWRLAEHS